MMATEHCHRPLSEACETEEQLASSAIQVRSFEPAEQGFVREMGWSGQMETQRRYIHSAMQG